MKNTFFLLVLIFSATACTPIGQLYNNFGEYSESKRYSDEHLPSRLYYDRHGHLYPIAVPDKTAFRKAHALLEQYYEENPSELAKAFEAERVAMPTNTDSENQFNYLQNHLLQKHLQQITNKGKDKKIVFLIHGYNNTGESASLAMEKLRVATLRQFPEEEFLFVEIYWDGLTKKNNKFNSSRIWDNAQVSASYAGLGLRQLLNGLPRGHYYAMTHSHGAAVITEALFNVRRFPKESYSDVDYMREIARRQNEYDTPTSLFSVGMLVPAIPGDNVFDKYYNRTENKMPVTTSLKNFRFVNGFNRYDFATSKVILAHYFGSTSLASKEKEHRKVQQRFNTAEVYSRVDFSEKNNHRQRSHAVKDYVAHPAFNEFLRALFRPQPVQHKTNSITVFKHSGKNRQSSGCYLIGFLYR